MDIAGYGFNGMVTFMQNFNNNYRQKIGLII
jgi:hypothetical protein